jgi:lipopolysaccharide export system permease protein
MLKKLHKLVVKSYIGPLVMTFFIAEFVLIMHFLWLYIGDLVGKGLEWHIILELLVYASAGLVKMALPLAILLASIMTFGNMGEHFELSAMKSAGISLQKIMKPLIIFSVVLSIGSFFFSNYVIPYTNLKMGSLLYDISNQRPEMNIKPGIFNNDIPNFSIKIRDKDRQTNMMYDFMVYDHRERRGNVEVTMADSGTMEVTGDQKYMIITLYGGKSYVEMKEDKPMDKKHPENHRFFDKQTIIFELEGLDLERTDENLFKHHYQMKRIDELQRSKDSLTITLDNRKQTFVKGLLRTKYFKYERKRSGANDSLFQIADSIHKLTPPEELKIVLNMDSLYNDANEIDKEKALQMAKENAENTRKYIESNKNDLYEREKQLTSMILPGTRSLHSHLPV